jgi:hypothetical protein
MEAVVSFSWSVGAEKWEHVSDCVLCKPGRPLPKAALVRLGELEVGTDRAKAKVTVTSEGTEAVVVVQFQDDFKPPGGPEVFTAHLVAEEAVAGVRLWRIDAERTLEANGLSASKLEPSDDS